MESVGAAPVMLTWAAERAGAMPEAVAAARAQGYEPGEPEDFERAAPDGGMLRWRLAYRHFTRAAMGAGRGVVPFLIDWKGSTSPAASAPAGCTLVGLRAEARDVAAVGASLEGGDDSHGLESDADAATTKGRHHR